MSSKMKTVRMYIFRGIGYIIYAGFFGLLTTFYWFYTDDMISAYLANVTGISLALIVEKIRLRRIYKKIEECTDDKSRSKLAKKDVASIKTSLYLFYIFALIFSQVLAMDSSIEVSENVQGYFESVEKGIILLFAIDTFLGYLISDDERVRKFKAKYGDGHRH